MKPLHRLDDSLLQDFHVFKRLLALLELGYFVFLEPEVGQIDVVDYDLPCLLWLLLGWVRVFIQCTLHLPDLLLVLFRQ